jgi:hypothetical protein
VGCIILQPGRPWVLDPLFKRSKYQKQQIHKADSISVVFYSYLHETILTTRWRRLSWYICVAVNTYTLTHSYIIRFRQIHYGFQFLTEGEASINVKPQHQNLQSNKPISQAMSVACYFPLEHFFPHMWTEKLVASNSDTIPRWFSVTRLCSKKINPVFVLMDEQQINCKRNTFHYIYKFTYTIFITNLLHNVFIVINYCSDIFRLQLSAIFRKLANLSTCAAYVSTYVGETPHIIVPIQ